MAARHKTHSSVRRRLLGAAGALGLGRTKLALGADADAEAAPQVGDWLVIAFGADAGTPLTGDSLAAGEKQIFAYPQSPATGIVRDGSRLNQVLVVRLDPAMLSEETAARSVNGIVAYSGVCSHTGCDVTDWDGEANRFQCPCHESQFDPADGARVVGGPAPWQLAALPLKLVDGRLAVAAEFQGRVGFMQPGALDPFGL